MARNHEWHIGDAGSAGIGGESVIRDDPPLGPVDGWIGGVETV